MLIDRDGDVLFARCTYDERLIFKDVGFNWNKDRRRWETFSIKKARETGAPLTDAVERDDPSRKASSSIDVWAPEGMSYFPFQLAGIEYMSARKDSLCADSPGIGKTIQGLGVINYLGLESALIIAPASLLRNWEKEAKRWLPANTTINICRKKFVPANVVIISSAMVKKFRPDIDKQHWDILIVDESHQLKTAKTQRTQAVLGGGRGRKKLLPIAADRRVFLSGTPMTSKPKDLWTTIKAFDPTGLGRNYKTYIYRYCGAFMDSFGINDNGASHMDELGERLRASFMVRRLKEEVLPDLPKKTYSIIELPSEGLSKIVNEERSLFAEALRRFEGKASNNNDAPDFDMETLADVILERFGHLQSMPLEERVKHLTMNDELIFEEISTMRAEMGVRTVPMVIKFCENLLESGEKLVIFAHHKAVVDELLKAFPGAATVTGSTPVDKRQDEVDKFQEDDTVRVIIGNITAAGVGHTLTAASNVVFAELPWTPADLEQASDRLARIGQLYAVTAYLMVVEGSLSSHMAKNLVKVQKIVKKVLD